MQDQVDSIPTTTEIEKQFKAQVELPATKPSAVESSSETEVKPPNTALEMTNSVDESRASLSTETPSRAKASKSEELAETAPSKTKEQPVISPETRNKESKESAYIPVEPSDKAPAAIANVEASVESSAKKDEKLVETVSTMETEQPKELVDDTKQQPDQSAPNPAPPSPPTDSPQSPFQAATEGPSFKPSTNPPTQENKEKSTKAEVDTKKQEEVSTTSTLPVESSTTQVVAKKYEALVQKADEALVRAKRDESRTPVSDWNWDSQCIERIGSNGPCIQSF